MRDEHEAAWALLRRGDAAGALARLEAMGPLIDDADAGDRATYFQSLAGVLEGAGRLEEALAAVETALALDRGLWPDGHGTLLSLRSMVIILERLGRREEAAARGRELLAIGEKLGDWNFAAAAQTASRYLAPEERRSILERARFVCQTIWRERRPKETERHHLVSLWSLIAHQLADDYVAKGDLSRAELALVEVTPHLASFGLAPMSRKLAAAWSKLGRIAASRREPGEARYFCRCALALADADRDFRPEAVRQKFRNEVLAVLNALGGESLTTDPTLDVLRVARITDTTIWVAHPSRGCLSFAREIAAPDVAQFDAVAVEIDRTGDVAAVRVMIARPASS